MKLYKYISLNDMWRVLDIVLNDKFYCARWDELNDPMEAYYECEQNVHRENKKKIKDRLNNWRIVAFSKSCNNYRLWSHYADGHRGIAIEIDVPKGFLERDGLEKVKYDIANSIFQHNEQVEQNSMRELLRYKTEEWTYEEEYRIIVQKAKKGKTYYKLPSPFSIKKIYIGCRCNTKQIDLLIKAVKGNKTIKLEKMLLKDGELKPQKK